MIDDNHKLTFFNDQNPYLNKLTDDDREQMEGDITEQECLSTFKKYVKREVSWHRRLYCRVL